MATSTKSRKSVTVPQVGEFWTDGKRMVEVVGRRLAGCLVIDVLTPLEEEADAQELLTTREIMKWRRVEREEEDG